jgi:hypothetical protein
MINQRPTPDFGGYSVVQVMLLADLKSLIRALNSRYYYMPYL